MEKKAKNMIFKKIKERNPTYDFYKPYMNKWETQYENGEEVKILKPLEGKKAEPFFLELGCNVFRDKKTGKFSIEFCETTESQLRKGYGKKNAIILDKQNIKSINRLKKNPDLIWYANFHTHPPLSDIRPSLPDLESSLNSEFYEGVDDNFIYHCIGNSAKNYNMFCFQFKDEFLDTIKTNEDLEKAENLIKKKYEQYQKKERERFFKKGEYEKWLEEQKERERNKSRKQKISDMLFELRNRRAFIHDTGLNSLLVFDKKTGKYDYIENVGSDAWQIYEAQKFKRMFKDILDIKIYSKKKGNIK